MRVMLRRFVFGLLAFAPLVLSADGGPAIRSPADLKGAHVAHLSSDFHREALQRLQPESTVEHYNEYAFAVESLRQHKIEAVSLGRTIADIWVAKYPGEFAVAFNYADDVCAFLLQKDGKWKQSLDAELTRMEKEGLLRQIVEKWYKAACKGVVPALPKFAAPPPDAPTVEVAAAAEIEPWCFVAEQGVVGADIEILSELAHRIGFRLKVKNYSWGGMLDAINANKADIACGGIYTDGRVFTTVEATRKYADEHMCVLVRARETRPRPSGLSAVWESLKGSFVRTFIVENRWKLLVRGLGITLLITFLSAVFGTLLAFPVWMARTSPFVPVARLARWYISLLQGTPVLVLLMILFYLVFGHVDINAVWVAVIGFSLNGSAYFGEMLRSGIDGVPKGQTEAALALGYGPRLAFLRFVLPQAVRQILPVYRGELIGLLKTTSIVGYIAINDLTKASDLVRSRTYESFFPILTTAFVYFVTAWLLALAIDRIGRRMDPSTARQREKDGNGEGGK